MSEKLQQALGRNLRQHRKELGLSQAKFADLLGFARSYIGSIERGERNLSLRKIELYAAKLDVEPNYLLRE
jgi:transcriptional regulator with XRE-family HTH domain